MLSFFPRGVLDEILNLIESVSEDFPSYSYFGRNSALSGNTIFRMELCAIWQYDILEGIVRYRAFNSVK